VGRGDVMTTMEGQSCGECGCFCPVIVLECIDTEQKDVDMRYCCVVGHMYLPQGVECSGACISYARFQAEVVAQRKTGLLLRMSVFR